MSVQIIVKQKITFMLFSLILYLLGIELRYREGMVVKKNSFQAFLFAARPNTLTAAVAPVLIGVTFAAFDLTYSEIIFGWTQYILCLIFAVGMQIASNLINDYFDFKKGADDKETRLGPPRACTMNWVDAPVMKKWIAIVISISLAGGLPLVYWGGWNLIWIGIVCVVFAFLYTTVLASKGLGDILVIVFFGIVPVNFMYYVETFQFSLSVFIISIGMGLVVDTLLIVNNYRDVEQDAKNGKKTLAVLLGRKAMPYLYLLCGIVGVVSASCILYNGIWIPLIALIPYLVLHIVAYVKMIKIGQGAGLNKVLELSATNIFLYGFLIAAGILIEKMLL